MGNEGPAADLRLSFDNMPEIYDRARPAYPAPLFVDLFSYARTSSPAAGLRVVEIGPGTGKATVGLLAHGAHVTAVEIGPRLADFLRSKFASEGRLTVINAAFEDVLLPFGAFDLVVSATAFHWVDQAIRLQKSYDVLRPGGTLAVIGTNQVESEADRGFFDRVAPIYRRYQPDDQPQNPPGPDVVPVEHDELRSSSLFTDIGLHRYHWDQAYSAAAYADLMRSYSKTQEMEPGPREALIAELCSVIEQEYGGTIVRPLVMTLTLGRRPL